MRHTTLWSCTHIPNKYYLKNNYLTLRSMVKVPRRSLQYMTHHLMVMHPHTKYHWPISKDKNIMARTRKYYLKNNYLTLRSKVKVPWRSLRYATHHLMVMHPHTKYHWPIWKDKKSYGPDKLRWEEAEEKVRLKQCVSLRSKGRHKNAFTFILGCRVTFNIEDYAVTVKCRTAIRVLTICLL
jgi:hypothetical protein